MIANAHLKDRGLSLKAMGLLTLMLSLPQTWSYSVRGLTAICGDGEYSVRSALKELEEHGYLCRAEKERDRSGHVGGMKYVVFETPRPCRELEEEVHTAEMPVENEMEKDETIENPAPENPAPGNPTPENPAPENHAQYNIQESKIQESKNHVYKIHPSINPKKGVDEIRRECREQLQADDVVSEDGRWEKMVSEMVEVMVEARLYNQDLMKIGGKVWSADYVRERYAMLGADHRDMILRKVAKHEGEIRNMKAYLATVMFNAPASAEFERYQAQHDAVTMYGLPGLEDVEEEDDLW